MDRYSILASKDPLGPQPVPESVEGAESPKSSAPEPLRFPGDDGGRSLSEMAQRDLTAALQLLAERAQYITGASGAAIALREGGEMICRASAGSSAPELGAHLQVDSGLSGESVRTKQILRCDDAESDPRVNRESCRALEIASVMVMPLIREPEVIGVFELFSGRVNAFEERDTLALQRIAEMILTAVDHADAAERAEKEIAGSTQDPVVVVEAPKDQAVAKPEEQAVAANPVTPQVSAPVASASSPERLNIHQCTKCGFPVSEGRILCIDCEEAQTKEGKPSAPVVDQAFVPTFGSGEAQEPSWLGSHWYVMAIAIVAAIIIGIWMRSR
jgi:putative methionine-R-sulfoxide reductase with GAF domain